MAIVTCASSGWLWNVACRVNSSSRTEQSGATKSRFQVPMSLYCCASQNDTVMIAIHEMK